MSILGLINAKVDVLTRTNAVDSTYGVTTQTWAVARSGVPCRITQSSAQEQVSMGGDRQVRSGTAAFLPSWTPDPSSRLTWLGRTLEILSVETVYMDDVIPAFNRVNWEEVTS